MKLVSFYKASFSQMLFITGFLKNFANLTRKHLCWSLFLINGETQKASI